MACVWASSFEVSYWLVQKLELLMFLLLLFESGWRGWSNMRVEHERKKNTWQKKMAAQGCLSAFQISMVGWFLKKLCSGEAGVHVRWTNHPMGTEHPPTPREIMQREDTEVCVISTRVVTLLLLRCKYKG